MILRTLTALGLLVPFAASGCTNMMTTRAIESFSESLAAANVEELRASSSERFEQQALRLPEAVGDFRILNLPTGETSVLNVEDVSDTMKHVTVEIGDEGEDKQTLEYHLTREPGEKNWVVDDIYMTQNLPGSPAPVTKSVTEQMDLLLTVREFLTSWQQGDRQQILDSSTAEFRGVLAELSPAHLHQLTQQFLDGVSTRSLRPQAQMEGDVALVKVPASRGSVMIQFEREDGRWYVANLSPDSHDQTEPLSALRLARALSAATRFLKAYERGDRQAISQLATGRFFQNSLVAAELSAVPLPVTELMAVPYEQHYHGDHVDLVMGTDAGSWVLTLTSADSGEPPLPGDDKPEISYAVEEVTIYENGTGQIKKLSSVFTAQAVVELYAQALGNRDRATLAALSTPEFNGLAWSRVDDVILNALPLNEIEPAAPRLVASVFKGPVVEMTVTQGDHCLTYVLHASHQGRMLVDDVLLPVVRRPNSLKANIEVLAPLYAFARGVYYKDLDMLRRSSGSGLNRKVWSQTTGVPDIGFALSDHLLLTLHSIRRDADQAMVSLTDGVRETDVSLIRENGVFVVQDVRLSVGEEEGQQVTLLNAMRDVLARQFDSGRNYVVPAGYEQSPGAGGYVDRL